MKRLFRTACALALVVTMFDGVPTAGAAQAGDSVEGRIDAQVSDALRFRREQGLSEDRALIESLLTSTGDPGDQEFGTPLTKEETALVKRRGEIQTELQSVRDYGAEHETDWGGIWLTYPVGATIDNALTVNVNLVGSDPVREIEVRSLLPDGVTVDFHKVAHSEAQLRDAHLPLRSEADTFFPSIETHLNAVETNTPNNSVDVYVSKLSPDIEAAVQKRFGDGLIRVFEGGESHPDACTRLNCGPPWKGGVKIVRVASDGQHWCTLGFVVRKYVTGGYVYAAWTAGHCGGGQWRQGTSTGAVIGTTSFKNGSPSYADVQVIPISAANRSNKIIDASANCTNCTLRSFTGTAQQGFNGDEFGDTVCNNGYATGHTCGLIKSTNVDNFPYLGVTLNNQRRATYVRALGDSGGPVFTTTGSLAAGSHVHYMDFVGDPIHYPIYSHVFEMSLLTGYYVYNGS